MTSQGRCGTASTDDRDGWGPAFGRLSFQGARHRTARQSPSDIRNSNLDLQQVDRCPLVRRFRHAPCDPRHAASSRMPVLKLVRFPH